MKVRALALGLLVLVSLAGCRQVAAPLPTDFVCAHCACAPSDRSPSHPVLCSTLDRDMPCCLVFGS